jgi:hydrogenase maturation protease
LNAAAGATTVVLGLGNPVISDDRVGLAVAAELRRLLERSPIPGVEVRESHRGGLEFIDLLSGFRRAIIVDCLTVADPSPGRIRRLNLEEAAGSARLVNPHEIGIAEAFGLAKRLGAPMPEVTIIYGIEGADTLTLSEEMTPAVAAAVEPAAQLIWSELKKGLESGASS